MVLKHRAATNNYFHNQFICQVFFYLNRIANMCVYKLGFALAIRKKFSAFATKSMD